MAYFAPIDLLFPIWGFVYFVTRPQLWAVTLKPLLCALLTVVLVTSLIFVLTFVPQTGKPLAT